MLYRIRGGIGIMQNTHLMTQKIQNETDLLTARKNLKLIYRDIMRLVIEKEEFEERIEEYLRKK
jgi:hypothetical protein